MQSAFVLRVVVVISEMDDFSLYGEKDTAREASPRRCCGTEQGIENFL